MELREVTSSVDIPKNTGIEGFLITLRELLKKPRVQEIRIDARGKISYRRMVQDGEDNALNVDLETVTPSGVMARAVVEELALPPHLPAAVALGKLFDRFAIDRVAPLAFVSGPGTIFWEWYKITTKSAIHSRDHIFGLPLITDKRVPDTALLLMGTTLSSDSIIDTTNVLKLEMETMMVRPPDTTVEVL